MSWLTPNFPSGEVPEFSIVDGRISFNYSTRNDDEVQTHPSRRQEFALIRETNTCLEPTLNQDEIANTNVENSLRTKRRKLTSKVWKEFIKLQEKDGKIWAICKHCNKKFDGSSKKGTTHLNNHSERCRSSKNEDRGGDTAANERGNSANTSVHEEKFVINQELNHLDVIRSIIKYGFSKLNFIKPDILYVYQEEKEKLRRCLTKLSCRFSLAIKWVDECFSMALHFIDDNWELKQKTISFHPATYSDFSETLKESLLDWNVDEKICSVVTNVDKEEVNEDISSWLSERGSLPFGGQSLSVSGLAYFVKSCSWTETKWAAEKIRKSFDHVRKASNKQNFEIAVDNAKSLGKNVTSRCIPRSSYGLEGLENAIGLKEAFFELEVIDYGFKSINLTKEEWDKATAIYEVLRVLNVASRSLSTTKCSTANAFFPKVCDIYMKLLQWERSENYHVCEIASRAREKFFDKYWCNSKLVLAVAVFLDPRFKMDIVERWYTEIYGIVADQHLKEIVDGLTNVYNDYAKGHSKMLDEMGRPCTLSQNSEIQLYLNEPKIPSVEEFDILYWWHLNGSIFPILARMARDFLAVPISPAAFSDSSSNTEIENIIFCYGLDVDIKPALVCTKSWLESAEK